MIVRARAPIFRSGLPSLSPTPPPLAANPHAYLTASEPAPDHPGAVISLPRYTRDAGSSALFGLYATSHVIREPERVQADAGIAIALFTRITPAIIRPILSSTEAAAMFPGAVIQIRAPYGISPLPARPIMARITVPGGELPAPGAGSVTTVQPRATSTRPRTANPQLASSEPVPLHSGSVLATHMPLEVSRPGRTMRVVTEDPIPAAGSVLALHPPAVSHRTVPRLPLVHEATMDRPDAGQVLIGTAAGRVDSSPARASVAHRPIRLAEVVADDRLPIASHGTPARVVPINLTRTVRDDSTSGAGSVVASHGPGGLTSLPRRPATFVRTEAILGDGAVLHSHGTATSVSPARARVVSSEPVQFSTAAVWHSSAMPPRSVPHRTSWIVRGDSLEPEHFAVRLVQKTSPVAPSPVPPTAAVGIRVYLTGYDRSRVTISSLDTECED
jgi:hypothetical protein